MTEDEMVGWYHQLDGHGFEQAPGVGDGQGSLVCCSPWGHKELDMIEHLKNKRKVQLTVDSFPLPTSLLLTLSIFKEKKETGGEKGEKMT